MLGSPERSPTPSPGRRHSFKGILRVELADAARQLGCQRQLQTIACLSFLAGAVWAVTLVGLGAAPLAHFQRHGGRRALTESRSEGLLIAASPCHPAALRRGDAEAEDGAAAALRGAADLGAAAAAVRRLLPPWDPLLAAEDVLRGLSYYGSGRRLQAVAAKLLAGQPIKVFTLGGSVTKGQGASTAPAAYPSRLFELINATFPHREHVFVNKGVGATSSGIFTACVEHMVAPDADLVVVELTINEHPSEPFIGRQRQGYEQLLRKLLKLPGRPAVVQVHHYAWWRAAEDGVGAGLFYFPQAEEQLTVLSHYYDVPSVSLRAAVYPLMLHGVPGFRVDKIWNKNQTTMDGQPLPMAAPEERPDVFYYDRTHPNDHGHQVIAELLAHVLARAVDEEHLPGWRPAGWAEPRDAPALRQLPPPMVPGNADAPTTLCAMQEEFEGVVTQFQGFKYKPERPQESTFVGQKWGWTADRPGAWLILEFDSRPDANTPARYGNWASVYLSHLKSYEGMGTATVACVSGCSCPRTLLDGTWDQQATLMQIHQFKVTQHRRCQVKVTVRKGAGAVPQKGHKVTLMAIMVSHYPLRLDTYDRTAEEFAAKLSGDDDGSNPTPGLHGGRPAAVGKLAAGGGTVAAAATAAAGVTPPGDAAGGAGAVVASTIAAAGATPLGDAAGGAGAVVTQ